MNLKLMSQTLLHNSPLYLVDPIDMPSALKQFLHAVPLPQTIDKKAVLSALLAREEVMSTAIGNGIAIPHLRKFGSESIQEDIVEVAYLFEPVDWKAPDGQPVHTIFLVLAADETRHLEILAEIARLASDESFVTLLKTMPGREVLLERLRQTE